MAATGHPTPRFDGSRPRPPSIAPWALPVYGGVTVDLPAGVAQFREIKNPGRSWARRPKGNVAYRETGRFDGVLGWRG